MTSLKHRPGQAESWYGKCSGKKRRRATMDACLIAAGQRAEHYEMAAYGTLVAWANAMGHGEAARLLQETLDEEKAADEKLSALAEGGINETAADAAHPDEEEEEKDDEEPVAVGAGLRKASRARRSRARAASQIQDSSAQRVGDRSSTEARARRLRESPIPDP